MNNVMLTILAAIIFSVIIAIAVGFIWGRASKKCLDAEEERSKEIRELYHDHY